jgi:hypoxanthine phosphoribosyltransferase
MYKANLKVLYTKETILQRVKDIAYQISHDYPSGNVLLVAVLKGAFVFLADLIRSIKIPVMIDFVQLSS